MSTTLIQKTIQQKRGETLVRRLEEWKKRNAQNLKGWNPVATLREWRGKRWSSSMHQ